MKETIEDKKAVGSGAWVGQFLTLAITALKLFCPHTFFLEAGEEVTLTLLNAFDIRLVPWIFVLNIMGYWLKKLDMPKWVPPMPILVLVASFSVCSLFGWAHTDATGAKAMVISIMEYGLGNGAIVALIATYGYDTVHSFTKRLGMNKEEQV